jgi:hypothetical protein
LRHFLGQSGAGIVAMRHCFGPKRRSDRRDGDKACWRRRLRIAQLCTKVAHAVHSPALWKFASVPENSPEIGNWPESPEYLRQRGGRRRSKGRCARRIPCLRGSTWKFTRISVGRR